MSSELGSKPREPARGAAVRTAQPTATAPFAFSAVISSSVLWVSCTSAQVRLQVAQPASMGAGSADAAGGPV